MDKYLGKKVFITGVSSGIGRELANEFLKRGASVIGVGKQLSINEELANSPLFSYISFDLNDSAKIDELINHLPSDIDFFISNAGMAYSNEFLNLIENEIIEQVNVNLVAPILLTNLILKSRKLSPHASLIYISSLSGLYPMKNLSIYCASKYGLEGFVATLREEIGHKHKITIVRPGITFTKFFERAGMHEFESEISKKKFAGHTPQKVAAQILRELSRDTIVVGSDKIFISFEKFIPKSLKSKFLEFSSYFNRFL